MIDADEVFSKLQREMHRYPPYNSTFEGYAVIKGQLDELWNFVRSHDPENAADYAFKAAASALQFYLQYGRK